MTEPIASVSGEPLPAPVTADEAPPRQDLWDGVGWTALGVAVFIGSYTMDRLERQDVNPYTVPGLLPAFLGLAMILLGAVLALRSWRRGAASQALPAATALDRESRRRVWVVIALCTGYGVVLVGHGLPFWVASTVYVTGSILVLQRMSHDPLQRGLGAKVWVKAVVVGLGAAVITHVVFQELFLVRLP
jgi:hypothetical protein